jgi:glutamate racemase
MGIGERPLTSTYLARQRMDFHPISFDATAGVVSAIRPTAQKVWNVELRLAPTQSALPQEVQDAEADDYGNDTGVKRVVQKGIVNLIADQHESTSDLEVTILHEAIGHVGVQLE